MTRHCSGDIALGFFLSSVVWSLLGNIAQGFYLGLSQEYNNNIEQDFSCAILSGASWTTLCKVFSVTCAMLSQEN